MFLWFSSFWNSPAKSNLRDFFQRSIVRHLEMFSPMNCSNALNAETIDENDVFQANFNGACVKLSVSVNLWPEC